MKLKQMKKRKLYFKIKRKNKLIIGKNKKFNRTSC